MERENRKEERVSERRRARDGEKEGENRERVRSIEIDRNRVRE